MWSGDGDYAWCSVQGGGGAVFTEGTTTLMIVNTTVARNTATGVSTPAVVLRSIGWSDNGDHAWCSVQGNGGALYSYGYSNVRIRIQNSIIANNTAEVSTFGPHFSG